jgi:hypothetical protein
MATEKVHIVFHPPTYFARFFFELNYCCEAPEKGDKIWVGQQGEKTNQGPESQLPTMKYYYTSESITSYD